MTDTIERRGGLRVHAPRIARCGHLAPYMGGVQRKMCDDCKWPQRSCPVCALDLSRSSKHRVYCSDTCRGVASGVVLVGPRLQATCALDGCAERFEVRFSGHRCCSEAHGKSLWRAEAKADGRIKEQPWNDRRRNNHYIRKARMYGNDGETVQPGVRY